MHAVRWVQADALAIRLRRVVQHLVNIGRTEVLAGAAEFFYAALVADIRVVNDEVRGLIFFMLRARVVEIGQFVESEFAVALCRPKDVGFRAAIRRQLGQLLHVLIPGSVWIARVEAAARP